MPMKEAVRREDAVPVNTDGLGTGSTLEVALLITVGPSDNVVALGYIVEVIVSTGGVVGLATVESG